MGVRESIWGYSSASFIFKTVSHKKSFAKGREAPWITTRQRRDHGQAMAKPWFHASLVPAHSVSRHFAKLFCVTFKIRLDDFQYGTVLRMRECLHTFLRCIPPSHHLEFTGCRLCQCVSAPADAMTRLILPGCWLDCWLLARLAGWLARWLAGWTVGWLLGWLSVHPTNPSKGQH